MDLDLETKAKSMFEIEPEMEQELVVDLACSKSHQECQTNIILLFIYGMTPTFADNTVNDNQ